MKLKKMKKVKSSPSKLKMKKKLRSPIGIKQKGKDKIKEEKIKNGASIPLKRQQKATEESRNKLLKENDTEMVDVVLEKEPEVVSVKPSLKKEEKTKEKKNKNPYTVFVGNLPFSATPEEVKKHFEKAGVVKEVRLPQDKATNRRRGFGYVQLKNRESYEKALTLHQSHLLGRKINVEYTTQGKKGGPKEEKIKQKNLKLRALAKKGILSSVRQKKSKETKLKSEGEMENQNVKSVKEKKKKLKTLK